MKKLIFFLLLFFGLSFGQRVITIPNSTEWIKVLSQGSLNTADTTTVFYVKNLKGAVTLWFEVGTVTSIGSDVTVKLQLYNAKTDSWADYYAGNTLTTLSSSLFTTGSAFYVTLSSSLYDQWAWADGVRFILSCTSASDLSYDVYIGGQ